MEGDGAYDAEEWGAFGTWPEDPLAPIPDHILDPAPLAFALMDAARTVSFALDWTGPGSPMTAAQARVAAFLARATHGAPVVNMADHFGVSSAAATQMLERMRKGGNVWFDEHPRDGRCRLVLLTDIGRERLNDAAAGLARRDRLLAISFGPGLAEDVLPALRDIARYFLHSPTLRGPDIRRPRYA